MNPTHVPLLLAVELRVPPAQAFTLPTEQARFLVDAIAADLLRLLPGVERLGLAGAGALYDPAQILRPAWPIFADLAMLYRGARRGDDAPAVMAFGTAGERMAQPALEPDPHLGGGPLLVLPLVLVGDADDADAIGARAETVFGEQGLAGAAVTLFLNQALGVTVEHARYFTHHDLCALTAIQLEHAEMGAAWPLIEAALLSPERDEFVISPEGQPWLYRLGEVRGAARGFAAWARGPGARLSVEGRRQGCLAWLRETRAFASLLAAHGLPPIWVDVGAATTVDATTLREARALAAPWVIESAEAPGDGPRILAAHEDEELGWLAISVLEARAGRWVPLAHGQALAPQALRALCTVLARDYGTAERVTARGAWRLNETGDGWGVPGGLAPPG